MKRFEVIISLYVLAESEENANKEARKLAREIDLQHDNKAAVTDIRLAEFGKVKKLINIPQCII